MTDATLIGVKKTCAIAAWAERHGLQTSIQERASAADFRRRPDERAVALCGLDNAAGRWAKLRAACAVIRTESCRVGPRHLPTSGHRRRPDIRGLALIFEHRRQPTRYRRIVLKSALERCWHNHRHAKRVLVQPCAPQHEGSQISGCPPSAMDATNTRTSFRNALADRDDTAAGTSAA